MTQYEDYVTYAQAVKLKELGFDLPCWEFYTDFVKLPCTEINPLIKPKDWNNIKIGGKDKISAPTLAQAQKWLRETHPWHIIIIPQMWKGLIFDYSLWHTMRGYENKNRGFNFSSYEAALSAGISAALDEINKTALSNK